MPDTPAYMQKCTTLSNPGKSNASSTFGGLKKDK